MGTPDDDATVRLPGSSLSTGSLDSFSSGAEGNSLPIGTRLGEFEIRGVIGEGGFSVVYSAWDHSLHRTVAIKEYIPVELAVRDASMRVTARSQRLKETFNAGLKSFVNEARLLASFDHPSLVKVHRFWEERGTAYMVMPLYEGPTLKRVLESNPQPPGEAWLKRLLDPLTEALSVLHAQNCYHRDIAPDNVLLIGPGQSPLLLDFGAARRVIGSQTHDLTAILKKGYAPVEQYGEVPDMSQGPWTDIYALAALVHFAICRRTPPPAVARLVNDTYVPLRSQSLRYSPSFLAAIDRALAVRPEDRTRSVADFRAQVGFGPDAPRSAAPRLDWSDPLTPGASPRIEPHAAVRPKGWLIAVAAAGAMSTVVAWLWLRSDVPTKASGSAEPPAPVETQAAGASQPTVPRPPAQPHDQAPTASPAKASPAASQSGDVGPMVRSPEPASSVAAATARPPAIDSQAAIVAEQNARRESTEVLNVLQRLALSEKRNVTSATEGVRAKQRLAQREAEAGRADAALVADREATQLAVKALNALVDDLVSRYSALAEQATAANQFEIAQQAIDRAKKIKALRR
jgi:serine/threonine protein kinase